jgi:hypothetical protein
MPCLTKCVKTSTRRYYRTMKWMTCVFDYSLLLVAILLLEFLFTNFKFGLVSIALLLVFVQCVYFAREYWAFMMFSDVIAEAKVEDDTPTNLAFYIRGPLYVLSGIIFGVWFGYTQGLVTWHYSALTWEGITSIYFEYLSMLVLKDWVVMAPLHRLAHNNFLGLYKYHKTHHTARDNCWLWNASQFDYLDLFIEDVCAPYILIVVRYALGYDHRVHLCAQAITLVTDMVVHSNNPYTVCYFNPILDWLFYGTVSHNLHHDMQNDHYTIVPWHHLIPGMKQKDVETYNKRMYTEFRF